MQIQLLYVQKRNIFFLILQERESATIVHQPPGFYCRTAKGGHSLMLWTIPEQPLDAVLAFFDDEARQRRMVEAEVHHDRPPLAGVVRKA